MAWKVEHPQSVEKLLQALIELTNLEAREKDPNDRMAYRGQADAAWKLQPTLDRVLPPKDEYAKRLAAEAHLVEEFKTRTVRFFDPLEKAHVGDRSAISTAALAVMQHYGAPTRLLDWSYSPFVALYFAAIHHPSKDGAMWCFPRKLMNDAADARWSTYGCRRERDGTVNLNAHAFTPDAPDWFCGTDYPVPFLRMTRQHGFFTMAGRLGVDHGEKIAEMIPDSAYVKKWIIPAGMKAPILDHLEIMNINAMSLHYEGADRIGREITESCRREQG